MDFLSSKEEAEADAETLTVPKRLLLFLSTYWRGFVIILTPLCALPVLLSSYPTLLGYHWCGYCLVVMAVYWMTECIPLPVTAFLPIIIFPLTGIMTTDEVCKTYMNDTNIMFAGSMFLAYSIQQSGLHIRIALIAIKKIGCSHYRLLFALCLVTMLISMWITNTAATVMVVPTVFALLRVFEDQGLMKIYDTDAFGDNIASDLTSCYFCSVTFSATIGGLGTLVGTATNIAFKGLYMLAYPDEPEYLSFVNFSIFSIPMMILMEICVYIYMIIVYFGYLRPNSKAAKGAQLNEAAIEKAKQVVDDDMEKLGPLNWWEISVIILFSLAILLFFCRAPQFFYGWGDLVRDFFGVEDKKYILDSVVAIGVTILMMLTPSTNAFFNNCKAKTQEELPNKPIRGVLDWDPVNAKMPYSFMFLLGGGFALSRAASANITDLNGQIGKALKALTGLPDKLVILLLITFTTIVTNFASNVATASVICPIAMQMAQEIGSNPLWFVIATGFAASFCFCLPVGTPGNLVVQSAANIPIKKMIIAGAGPSVTTVLLAWFFVSYYAPVVWPVLKNPVPLTTTTTTTTVVP